MLMCIRTFSSDLGPVGESDVRANKTTSGDRKRLTTMHFRGAESARDWLCVTIVLSIKEPASLGKQAIEQTAGCCVTRIVQWCLSLAVLIAKRSNVFQSWVGVGMRGEWRGVGGDVGKGGWGMK